MKQSIAARRGSRACFVLGVCVGLAALGMLVLPRPSEGAGGAFTERVSVGPGGGQVYLPSISPDISADGRFVSFESRSAKLVAGDTNGVSDIFVRDRQSGTIERVSLGLDGAEANNGSQAAAVSRDGRFVAFTSYASNLVAGDTNGNSDIFVRDRQSGTTERVSLGLGGAQANSYSSEAAVSADGRFVVFYSLASNLVAGDSNNRPDVFIRDRQSGTTERVSSGPDGAEANGESKAPDISADGRFVTFFSWASNLVPGDTNAGDGDVFVRDRQTGTIELVSVGSDGAQANGNSSAPSISADGRFVAFESRANFVAGDVNGDRDVFIRDRQNGTTERVSVGSYGTDTNRGSWSPDVSADGRFVAFGSNASNLVAGDTNGMEDVFVHDREGATTERVSVGSSGAEGNGHSAPPRISADGRFVVFYSLASNLVAGDTNDHPDIFVRDRGSEECTIVGSPGADVLSGTPGDDVICGLGGNDQLIGADGDDRLVGGDGDDSLSGEAGGDRLEGGNGQDRLQGGPGADMLGGGPGDDRLAGDSAKDHLDGGLGGDLLSGGSGADVLGGGPGEDRAHYLGRSAPVTVTIGDGAADGEAGEGDDVMGDVENLSGGSAADRLTGHSGPNKLAGGGGNDHLFGGDGHSHDSHDTLNGGDGEDSLFGGKGNDSLYGESGNDSLSGEFDDDSLFGGAGDDSLFGELGDDSLFGELDDDGLSGGAGDDSLSGGAGDDSLSGELGDDSLDGGFEQDLLSGGVGADVLGGGPGEDHVHFWGRPNPVTVTIGDGPDDGEASEGDDVKGDVENLSGGRAGDRLIGDAGPNKLAGNGGNDYLIGGAGPDNLHGHDGDDTLDSRDDARDSLYCSDGIDTALRDPLDWVSSACENR